MKKAILLLCVALISIPALSSATDWWNDWRPDPNDDNVVDDYDSGYDDGYDDGYDEGYTDGSNDPFFFEDDKVGAFGEWFLSQSWTGKEQHAWEAVFQAMLDGRDRSLEPRQEINTPAYIALISGACYHTDPDCGPLSNARTITKMDETEAQERGFEPCSRCSKSANHAQ